MKVYVHTDGILLVGKGWEIVQKLKEYTKYYSSVSDWIDNVHKK
jgi:hypothetical protein